MNSFLLRSSLLAFLTGFLLSPVRAQVDVSVSTLVRVGVSINGATGSAYTQIISADLRRTGMISPVGGGSGEFEADGDANGGG